MLGDLPPAGSSFAGEIDWVMFFIYLVTGVWFVAAEALLVWMLVRGRRREGARAAWMPGDTWRAMSIVLVPCALVLVCDFAIEVVADPVWAHVKQEAPQPDLTVGITGRQFTWVFRYPGADGVLWTKDDRTATELHVPVDKVIRFELEAADVLHCFYVPELRLKQDAVPGRRIPGWFRVPSPYRSQVVCAELCGSGHTGMRAPFVAETQSEFDTWLATQ